MLNTKPDFRLFPNQISCTTALLSTIHTRLDSGMWVLTYSYLHRSCQRRKKFDFIYIGEMTADDADFGKILDCFNGEHFNKNTFVSE